jgi:hypothetical protein
MSAVIQEIVDRSGWSSGNALAIIITGSGKRVADSFDGDANGAPLLHLRYVVDGNAAPGVAITAPPDGTSVNQGDAVTFAGTATDAEDGDLSASLAWVSDRDGALGTGASITRSDLSLGAHVITASVTDSGGRVANDQIALTITSGPQPGDTIIETRVGASSDDAEEDEQGRVNRSSSDLELVFAGGNQTVGMRFSGVGVPPGATILEAYLQFQVDETGSDPTSLSTTPRPSSTRPETSPRGRAPWPSCHGAPPRGPRCARRVRISRRRT